MADRRRDSYRLLFLVLLAANVLVLAYVLWGRDEGRTAARIQELQMNAERIRIVDAAARGARSAPPAAPSEACLEWGPFAAESVARAHAVLEQLALAQKPVLLQQDSSAASFFVREPDEATVARMAELRQAFPGTAIRAAPCPAS